MLPAQTAAKPNIVVVLADDLAAWMVGCYGNTEVKTPNIDRLARMGTRFVNSFVCTPICSPSRATLFSGRTPRQHGIHDFLTENPVEKPPQGQKEAPASFANEVLLSDLLAASGYRCGYAGKWHMGNDAKPGHGLEFTYTLTGGARSYVDPEMSLNGEVRKENGYLTELITAQAVGFLEKQSKDKPFFLTLAYLNPHTPYSGHPQKYYDMYENTPFNTVGFEPGAPNALREKGMLTDMLGNMRKAAASVTALDEQIPVLQKKLQEKGLWENTIFILTGDNGYLHGRHGLWSKGLASDPINMFDEVMKVPMIWAWPGRIPVEGARPELISFYDFLPTICEITGANSPAGRNLIGRSYANLIFNKPFKKGELWQNMIFGQFRNTEMARDPYYKLVLRNNGEGPNELFDLRQDPRERVNRYENPGFVTIRERLAAALSAWKKRAA
ncbi:MAG: sulfatase [Bryobacteraceae bacterium]